MRFDKYHGGGYREPIKEGKMKTLIIFLLLTGVAMADETYLNPHEIIIPPSLIVGKTVASELRLELSSDNKVTYASDDFIKELAATGRICEVYGHRWSNSTENIVYSTNPPSYPPNERTCDLCGKQQVERKTTPVWEDVE